jgi:hypothetical protein
MNDPEVQLPPRQTSRFQYRLRTIFLVFFAVAVLLGFWTLRQRQRLADLESLRFGSCPVALHIVYRDTVAPNPPGLHEGTATYVFKNRLPIKIKIAFPPISCVPDNVVAFARDDLSSMPCFCRKPQLVELPPNGEARFQAGYTVTGDSPPQWLLMFGNPSNSQDPDLVLTPVHSTSEWGPAGTPQTTKK